MASTPTAPTVPRSVPAAASTLSVSSDSTPPTTGIAPDTASFVTLTAVRSAEPVSTPAMAR